MVDKNNQIYELKEITFPELPLLMIPKMEKITSFERNQYFLSFEDYAQKHYNQPINSFENVVIFDSKQVFKEYLPYLKNYQNKLRFDLYVNTKICKRGYIRKSRSDC